MASLTLWQLLLLRLVVAVLVAAGGAAVSLSFRRISHLGLCLLISFAAGALLAVAVLDIFPESVELVGWKAGIQSILSGYFLFYALNRFVFHICPACAATHTETNFKALTLTMVTALSVHSFMDGLAVYSGYLATSEIGLLVLLAVTFHKFPEGMALALVARGSGMTRGRSFTLASALEGGTTFAGGLAGLAFLAPESSKWLGYVLGHVGGGFVFIVVHALLSEFIKHHPLPTIAASLAGALAIALLGFSLGAF